jgi:hypothetical protein
VVIGISEQPLSKQEEGLHHTPRIFLLSRPIVGHRDTVRKEWRMARWSGARSRTANTAAEPGARQSDVLAANMEANFYGCRGIGAAVCLPVVPEAKAILQKPIARLFGLY